MPVPRSHLRLGHCFAAGSLLKCVKNHAKIWIAQAARDIYCVSIRSGRRIRLADSASVHRRNICHDLDLKHDHQVAFDRAIRIIRANDDAAVIFRHDSAADGTAGRADQVCGIVSKVAKDICPEGEFNSLFVEVWQAVEVYAIGTNTAEHAGSNTMSGFHPRLGEWIQAERLNSLNEFGKMRRPNRPDE